LVDIFHAHVFHAILNTASMFAEDRSVVVAVVVAVVVIVFGVAQCPAGDIVVDEEISYCGIFEA
jgi:hypothetical protein